jgi:hypothetical protein
MININTKHNKIKDFAIKTIEKRSNTLSQSLPKTEQMYSLIADLHDTMKAFEGRNIKNIDSEVWYNILRPVVKDIQKFSKELLEINDKENAIPVNNLSSSSQKRQLNKISNHEKWMKRIESVIYEKNVNMNTYPLGITNIEITNFVRIQYKEPVGAETIRMLLVKMIEANKVICTNPNDFRNKRYKLKT